MQTLVRKLNNEDIHFLIILFCYFSTIHTQILGLLFITYNVILQAIIPIKKNPTFFKTPKAKKGTV